MMAWAKLAIPCSVASGAAVRSGKREMILSTGKATPMIPVEEGNTSVAGIPNNALSARQTRWQAFMPDCPVAQLALRSEEHTSELQSLAYLVCRLLLEK